MDESGFVLILLGPPGVGKGTQGAMLAESMAWERIATGDLLRAARREGTELGRRAQSYMDAGDLVPDELIVGLVRERLNELSRGRGVIFDGFPRNVPQAHDLAGVLDEVGRSLDAIVLLEAPDDALVKRISGRRSCSQCGRIYNTFFDPPINEGVCDECGARLDHRKDDDPDTVRHRLEVYRNQTEPLVDHYESSSAPVIRVEGVGSLDDVAAGVRQALADVGVKETP